MCGGLIDGRRRSFSSLLDLIIALFVIDFLVGGINRIFNLE